MVEVVAVLLTRNGHVLTVFNPRWGAFTMPMTKRRTWNDPAAGGRRDEAPQQAAVRAAAEALGKPLPPGQWPQRLEVDVEPYQQSDRDGLWKRYTFHVFWLPLDGPLADAQPRPWDNAAFVWVSAEEIQSWEPVSLTARHVLDAAGAAVGLAGL